MTSAELAARLPGSKRRGRYYDRRCPAHEDTRPSLTFWDSTDRIQFKCRAGCTSTAVARAVAALVPCQVRDFDLCSNGHPHRETPVTPTTTIYTYETADGAINRQVLKSPGKKFQQRRPDPDHPGEWLHTVTGIPRLLYHWPQLQGAKVVYYVEGEKDADRLADLGLIATTHPCGAGAFRREYAQQLAAAMPPGGLVVVLRDEDPEGLALQLKVLTACATVGLTVKALVLEDVPTVKGADISDWLDAGHTRAELEALVARTPDWTPAPERRDGEREARRGQADPGEDPDTFIATGLPEAPAPAHAPAAARVQFRAGADLDATPITYVVDDMLPTGMLSALGGKDGMGKTLLGMEIIKCVLTGQKLFGRFAVQQGPVYALFLDDPEFLVRERLAALGILEHPQLHVATEQDVDMTNPRAMLTALIAVLKTADPPPTFIFVDALYLFIPSGGASDQGNSAGAMAPVIAAFNQVTRETGSALLLVAHDNKAGSDLAGSYAIRAGIKAILRLLFPPAIATQVAAGDEEARETPERMLQLNKLKTGRPASWYLRLEGAGHWTFHGGARAYRAATLLDRVVACVWARGASTAEEIAKDLHARPAEVRGACLTLYLANRITRGERPREDGKPGRMAIIYGPKPPANGDGTDSSKPEKQDIGTDTLGTDRSGEENIILSRE